MASPRISIIILNYNSSAFTIACVASIRQHTQGESYEIVVVDNNSAVADYDRLRSLVQDSAVKLIRSRLNLGFSGGNMLGVQVASPTSDYLFFLNNDCEFLNNVCAILLDYMETNPSVGLCTAQMYDQHRTPCPSLTYFPSVGTKILGHTVLRWFKPDDYPPIRTTYTKPIRVPVIPGAAMFVRASAFAAVGGFDTVYFLYCEEEDFSRRLQQRGFTTSLVPAAQYIHYVSQSTTRSLAIEQEFFISLFYYFRKFYSPLTVGLLRVFYAVKNARKFYRNRNYAKLGWFILCGSPARASLRHRQQLSVDQKKPSLPAGKEG